MRTCICSQRPPEVHGHCTLSNLLDLLHTVSTFLILFDLEHVPRYPLWLNSVCPPHWPKNQTAPHRTAPLSAADPRLKVPANPAHQARPPLRTIVVTSDGKTFLSAFPWSSLPLLLPLLKYQETHTNKDNVQALLTPPSSLPSRCPSRTGSGLSGSGPGSRSRTYGPIPPTRFS